MGTADVGGLICLSNDANGDGILDGGDTLANAVQMGVHQTAFAFARSLTAIAANHFLIVATDAAGNVSP